MSGREIKNGEIRFLFGASPGYLAGSALCGWGDTTLSPCRSKQGQSPKRTLCLLLHPKGRGVPDKEAQRNFLWRRLRRQGNLPNQAVAKEIRKAACTLPIWLHLNNFSLIRNCLSRKAWHSSTLHPCIKATLQEFIYGRCRNRLNSQELPN